MNLHFAGLSGALDGQACAVRAQEREQGFAHSCVSRRRTSNTGKRNDQAEGDALLVAEIDLKASCQRERWGGLPARCSAPNSSQLCLSDQAAEASLRPDRFATLFRGKSSLP